MSKIVLSKLDCNHRIIKYIPLEGIKPLVYNINDKN